MEKFADCAVIATPDRLHKVIINKGLFTLTIFHGLFRQSLNGTGTGNLNLTDIMRVHSHCNGTGTGNLRACLRVLNKDPNNPRGFVYIMLANDITLV